MAAAVVCGVASAAYAAVVQHAVTAALGGDSSAAPYVLAASSALPCCFCAAAYDWGFLAGGATGPASVITVAVVFSMGADWTTPLNLLTFAMTAAVGSAAAICGLREESKSYQHAATRYFTDIPAAVASGLRKLPSPDCL
jgi:hypothetical protein